MIDQNTKAVIEDCAKQSHDGLLTFPEVLGRLVGVGVQSYFVDYRLASTTYYLNSHQAYQIPTEMPALPIPHSFNKIEVVSAIRGAQSDLVRYPEFLRLTMLAGCIGYVVWITGKHVTYFGAQGEMHIEHFPS